MPSTLENAIAQLAAKFAEQVIEAVGSASIGELLDFVEHPTGGSSRPLDHRLGGTTRRQLHFGSDDGRPEFVRALVASLERNHGNASAVARELRCARRSVYRWIKNLGLDRIGFARSSHSGGNVEARLLPSGGRTTAAARAVSKEQPTIRRTSGRLALDRESARGSSPPSDLTARLARHNGNVSAVAREMGEHRTQVRRWITRLGLDYPDRRFGAATESHPPT